MSATSASKSGKEHPTENKNKLLAASIHFGNRTTRAAILDESDFVRIIPNRNNELDTPSVVAFTDLITFGKRSADSCLDKQDTAIYREGTDPKICQEVISMMSSINVNYIEQLVLTISPYFTSIERKAVLEEARRKCRNVLLINDITAILYRHLMEHMSGEQFHDANYIVYNLGCTSLDCAVYSVKSGEIQTKNIVCAEDLGDIMITKALMSYLIEEHCPKEFEEMRFSDKQLIKLEYEAERIKSMLSCENQAVFEWRSLGFMTNQIVVITSGMFEEIVSSVLTISSVINCTHEALEKSVLSNDAISQVILSGDSCIMPLFSNIIKSCFQEDLVITSEDPEMDAVVGAALYARERIPQRSLYPLGHLIDIRHPSVVARNILTNQSIVLVPKCNNLMKIHTVQRLIKTHGDEIQLEILEELPNGKNVVIGKYTKVLAISHEEEIPLEFTINIDQNGIATITKISMFKATSPIVLVDDNSTTEFGKSKTRKLEDTDDDDDDNNEEYGCYTISHTNSDGNIGTIDFVSNIGDLQETISAVCELTGLNIQNVVFVKNDGPETQKPGHFEIHAIEMINEKGEIIPPEYVTGATSQDPANNLIAENYNYCAGIIENMIKNGCVSEKKT